MVIEICEHGIGIGGMGLMRVDPLRLILNLNEGILKNEEFLIFDPTLA